MKIIFSFIMTLICLLCIYFMDLRIDLCKRELVNMGATPSKEIYRCLEYDKKQIKKNSLNHNTLSNVELTKNLNDHNPHIKRLIEKISENWLNENCILPCTSLDYADNFFFLRHLENRFLLSNDFFSVILSTLPEKPLNKALINFIIREIGAIDSNNKLLIQKSNPSHTISLYTLSIPAGHPRHKIHKIIPFLNKPLKFSFIGFKESHIHLLWNYILYVNYSAEKRMIELAEKYDWNLDEAPVNIILHYFSFFFKCLKNDRKNRCEVVEEEYIDTNQSYKTIGDIKILHIYVFTANKEGKMEIGFAQKHKYK